MQAPGEIHIQGLKKGLRYLRGRLDEQLVYDFRRQPARGGLYGFFDASHADDIDTRKSTIAYVFFYAGCAISWKTKLHSFVTTSTNHSELVAAAMAAREAKFLWRFSGALDPPAQAPRGVPVSVDLFTDSMAVVALSRNSVSSSATKHIEIADFFVRELVERGVVTVAHVPTESMVADVLTKPLSKLKFFRFMGIILGTHRFDFDRISGQSTFGPTEASPEERSGTADKDDVPNTGGRGGRPKFPRNLAESRTGPMGRPTSQHTPSLVRPEREALYFAHGAGRRG